MHLYEIAADYQNVIGLLENTDTTDVAGMEAVSNAIEQVGEEFNTKAVALVHYATNIGSDIDAIDTEIARLNARKKSMTGRMQWLNEYLLMNMQRCGISEIKHPAFTIRLRDNPESVVVADESVIPAEFMKVPPPPKASPDKNAIKAAIKEGRDVPGCHLERKQRVEIR